MKKNKITQINCHAEFSSASHGILKQVQDDRNNESGRSMVEMLGVLAIIGVLSVGGIAGYTTAMNSHRANEAIQNATRLAVLLSSKRLLNSSATLSEDELAGTGFEIADDTDKIVLSVSVSDAVKSKIEGMGLKMATLGTNSNKLTFTFNNDLSEGNASGQGETCAGVKCGDGCCSSGLACNNGQCCSTEKCCPSSQIPFCNAESSDGDCLEWSCGDAEGTLSDWAQPPSGTRYRISCPKGSKPYCTFAVAPGDVATVDNQAYCYEVQCCDGTVVDARTEALASGGGSAQGSCQH